MLIYSFLQRLPLFNSVKRTELPNLLIVVALKFIASFLFMTLKEFKEPLVIERGIEVLPYLKMLVSPCSILLVVLYTTLSSRINFARLFYLFAALFFSFLILYLTILYPYSSYLCASEWAQTQTLQYPKMAYLIYLIAYWPHSTFYIVAEVFGEFTIAIFIWTTINRLYTFEQAKRFYGVIIGFGALGGAFPPLMLTYLLRKGESISMSNYDSVVYFMLSLAAAAIPLMIYLFMKLQANSKEKIYQCNKLPSVTKSFKAITTNTHLLAIAIMVICCGVCINLVGLTWDANIEKMYPTRAGYQRYKAFSSLIFCVLSFVLSIMVNKKRVNDSISWKRNALFSPFILMFTGLFFFICSKYQDKIIPYLADLLRSLAHIVPYFIELLQNQVAYFVITLGTIENIIAKTTKYALFDHSKEVAFVPLPSAIRDTGKASVDFLCSKLGKSLSGLIHGALLFLFASEGKAGSLLDITFYVILAMIITFSIWIYAIFYLSKKIEGSVNK